MGSDRRRLNGGRAVKDPLLAWIRALEPVASTGHAADTNGRGHQDVDPVAVVGRVVATAHRELKLPTGPATEWEPWPGLESPPGGWDNPWLPGLVHEQLVAADVRQRRGAWYTPPGVVKGLVGLLFETAEELPTFALDPTCGGGAFLLAVLDRWVADGVDPAEAVTSVAGVDIDAGAAAVSQLSIQFWAALHGLSVEQSDLDVRVADTLMAQEPDPWPEVRLVVGNPPFGTPLRKGGIPESAEQYRGEHRRDLGPYADLAAIHLHRAMATVGVGSLLLMVLPQSVLSSRDVAPLRELVAERGSLRALWAAREPVFDAGVRTCAPVIAVETESAGRSTVRPVHPVRLSAGATMKPMGQSDSRSWSICAARALGGPVLPASVIVPASVLGDMCSATAGFRDEYYGLLRAAVEWDDPDGEPPNRLVTVGSIDPLATSWGRVPLRFGGRAWQRPWVPLDRIGDDKVGRWLDRQLKPKVVLATQSKMLEPLIDPTGTLIPTTPLLSVHADADDLAHIAAVLLSPPVVAGAWQRWFGSALAVDALKLAARQVGELPLPPDRRRWDRAAAIVGQAVAHQPLMTPEEGWTVAAEVGSVMNEAYRADEAVLRWWRDRRPGRIVRRPEGVIGKLKR